jgi:hypothetical protein
MLTEKNSRLKVLLFVLGGLALLFVVVYADSSSTSVNVQNTAPQFTAGPAENPASTSTSPNDVGTDVTFEATASDPNTNQYYLAICKSDAISAGDDAAPTCTAGAWCVSTATASGGATSCSYTTLTGDSEVEAWYAFVCDKVAGGGACSSSSQGSGDSGSPFNVNHRPSFTAVNDDGPKNPGEQVTFTATASDADVDGTPDTVKLIVCNTNSITGQTCDDTQLCASSLVASNPSCSYTLDNPLPDQAYNYYGFVFDSHDFAATSSQTDTYTVSNVAPVVSSVVTNTSSNITLTENTTVNVTITGTVTDNNSCTDLTGGSSAILSSLYRSGVTFASCDDDAEDDNNDCYADFTCSVVASGNTCDGITDSSADYECTTAVQYHADPTDGTSTDTQYYDQTWLSTIHALDDDAASDDTEATVGVEMVSLIALQVTAAIDYGNLPPGGDSGSSPETTTVSNTGNVGLDTELSGTAMSGPGTDIPVGNQEYDTSTFTWGAGTDLTGSAVEVELDVLKTTVTASPATDDVFWGLGIPSTQVAGAYTGTNTVTAARGEVAQW